MPAVMATSLLGCLTVVCDVVFMSSFVCFFQMSVVHIQPSVVPHGIGKDQPSITVPVKIPAAGKPPSAPKSVEKQTGEHY